MKNDAVQNIDTRLNTLTHIYCKIFRMAKNEPECTVNDILSLIEDEINEYVSMLLTGSKDEDN